MSWSVGLLSAGGIDFTFSATNVKPLQSRVNDSSLTNSEAMNAWISNFRPSANHRDVILSIFSTITKCAVV